MDSIQSVRLKFAIIFLAFFSLSSMSEAQGIQNMHQDALKAMKTGNWKEAHKILVKAIDNVGIRAPQAFGSPFAWFWYHRGYCEIKLGMFDDAMNSFERCYTKFKNVIPLKGRALVLNPYNKKALLMRGHAAKGAGEWATSIRMYKKFLAERDPTRDHYERGILHINMAINYYKLKKIAEGSKHLEIALKEKATFPTPNKGIMSAFNSLAASAIEKKEEASLLEFLHRNRQHLKLEPFEAHEFSPLFMKLAEDAHSAGMIRSAFVFYSLVPSTLATIDDLKSRLSTLASYDRTIRDGSMIVKKSNLTEDLTDLEMAYTSGKVNEIYAYLRTAILHEEDGNVRGAFAVYEQMELYFPNAKVKRNGKISSGRKNNLYNLVRTSSLIGEALTTEHYGATFLKDFPESKYVKEVRRMMLTSLFYNGEYEKCIEVAERMLPQLTKPSKRHAVCLFTLGGSKHYLGEFRDAQPLLNEYLETYGNKKGNQSRIKAASYFQAANYSHLQHWTKSAKLLDEFFKKNPDLKTNPYFPYALYDRANCDYAQGENEEALTKVNRIATDFPDLAIMEQTLALKGNILENLRKPEEAERSYKKALFLAEKKKNEIVAGECLFYLTALLGGETEARLAEAIPYYNHFWKNYGNDSPFSAKVAVAGIPAMRKAGKIKEALERLQSVIAASAKNPGTPGLEEAIGSYTAAYLKDDTPEQLRDHYSNQSGGHSRDRTTPALLRSAIIAVYEEGLDSVNPENARDSEAMIHVLYKELRSDFFPKDLPNFTLIKLGNYLQEQTPDPETARIYYDELLGRPNRSSHQFTALLGLAKLNAEGDQDQKAQAIQQLRRVIDDSAVTAEQEEALYLTASIHFENGQHDAAITSAKEYLKERTFRRYRSSCGILLAAAHDKAGHPDKAIIAYRQILSSSNSARSKYLDQAMLRYMELLWKRNGTNTNGVKDRQGAYEMGYKYLQMTKLAVEKASPEKKATWDKIAQLVSTYETSPDTTKIVE